jgi:hypothetical protein
MEQVPSQHGRRAQFLEELEKELSDDIHRRLIRACQGSDPVKSMESELGTILLEILHRED